MNIIYGTAWKEEATEDLVRAAFAAGYRAFDTANQRKHYVEDAVGRALAGSLAGVWIQTKFTFVDGQDQRLPYDPAAPIATQVRQSYDSSLAHLGRVDSYVLHGPSRRDGLGPDDHAAWRAMEDLGVTLGVSNVTGRQVDDLVAFARVKPAWVQNRCYAARGWDADVRAACARHGIAYQGFSLLTANRQVVSDARLRAIATRHRATPAQTVLRFAQQVGMVPLTGTRDPVHMAHDIALDFELDVGEIDTIRALT